MRLDDLKPPKGARKKRKRVGRGTGSGHGKTACRGSKGQRARAGGPKKAGFEGGQMPLQRRLPKRGFRHPLKRSMSVIHLRDLNRFESGSIVDPDLLLRSGLVRKRGEGVKLLSDG